MKKKEFQDLKQGSISVNEYVTKFTQLSCYAPHEVDTDKKKQECFLNGLNDGLAYALEARDFENFQGMVNKALVLENCRGAMEHKCKLVSQQQPCSSSRPRVTMPFAVPVFRPAQSLFQPRPQVAGQSECSEDSCCSEPTTGGTEVFCLWGERSLCQPVSQSTQPPSSDSCVHSCTYPWGKFYSCCC
jgi:hypothetical protein